MAWSSPTNLQANLHIGGETAWFVFCCMPWNTYTYHSCICYVHIIHYILHIYIMPYLPIDNTKATMVPLQTGKKPLSKTQFHLICHKLRWVHCDILQNAGHSPIDMICAQLLHILFTIRYTNLCRSTWPKSQVIGTGVLGYNNFRCCGCGNLILSRHGR